MLATNATPAPINTTEDNPIPIKSSTSVKPRLALEIAEFREWVMEG
jgi:hypothetical protein